MVEYSDLEKRCSSGISSSCCKRIRTPGFAEKRGILLAQLGTPDSPETPSLRRYLRQFLSDPRVVETNRAAWFIILNACILPFRPRRSAVLYQKIWTREGSPLLKTTRTQAEELARRFQAEGVMVSFGMRYGSPSLESALDRLISNGCRSIVLLPLFPQYSAATTGSACDAVYTRLLKERWVPALSVVPPYYKEEGYLAAVAERLNCSLDAMREKPDRLILSYHGLPRETAERGDPYCCMCHETTLSLIPRLRISADRVIHCYQSRFGSKPWLTPYLDDTVKKLAVEGVKRLAVASPAFTADCLETLQEIAIETRDLFIQSGGEELNLLPCLNDSTAFVDVMETLCRRHLV